MIATDLVIPYQVERASLRGRFLRFGPLLGRILDRHGYPPPVSALLGETMVLTALLGSTLKYEGAFTLQATGKGPVRIVIGDMTSAGEIRAYAQFDAEAVPFGFELDLGDLAGVGAFVRRRGVSDAPADGQPAGDARLTLRINDQVDLELEPSEEAADRLGRLQHCEVPPDAELRSGQEREVGAALEPEWAVLAPALGQDARRRSCGPRRARRGRA